MSSGQKGWLLLFMIGLFFVIVGFQGNLGCCVAILFCPQNVLLGPTQAIVPPGTIAQGTPGTTPTPIGS